jgi:hypothetical protein
MHAAGGLMTDLDTLIYYENTGRYPKSFQLIRPDGEWQVHAHAALAL